MTQSQGLLLALTDMSASHDCTPRTDGLAWHTILQATGEGLRLVEAWDPITRYPVAGRAGEKHVAMEKGGPWMLSPRTLWGPTSHAVRLRYAYDAIAWAGCGLCFRAA